MARPRQAAVESYRSCSVSTVATRTPATLRRSRPTLMPSARTKKDGHKLCGAEEFRPRVTRQRPLGEVRDVRSPPFRGAHLPDDVSEVGLDPGAHRELARRDANH